MCGNITEWGVDVHSAGSANQPNLGIPYTLDLQVWRPSPTVDDSSGTGCYSLVGNNRFTRISLSNQVAIVTPSPQDYIQFQPEDVLGFYVEQARQVYDGVVILTSYGVTTSFTSEIVWYASIAPSMATSQNGDCPYSVGSSGVLNTLTRAAPVISISTVTYSCSPLHTMTITQPTSPPNPTTNQQTQEPVDSSEGADTELRVPSTSETATDLPILKPSESTNIGLIIGTIVIVLVVIIVTLNVIIITVSTILFKKKAKKGYSVENVAVSTTSNQSYGLANQSEGMEQSMYSYPEVDIAVETKKNENYAANTDIITEGNQAYAMNIITEKNAAYKPVTTVTVETIDEYDYI